MKLPPQPPFLSKQNNTGHNHDSLHNISSTSCLHKTTMLDPTQFSDHIRLDNHNNNSIYGARKYSLRARKTAQNYANFIEGFAIRTNKDDYDDGTSAPPLWRSSSPPTSPSYKHHHFRSLSPPSRTQAIARGQREMMELVSKLPEGCYELSLKDLVEHPIIQEIKQQESLEASFIRERNNIKSERNSKKVTRKVKMNRNGNVNNGGFLLKMVFPVSWGPGKKKINRNNSNSGCKERRISPKPLLFEGSGNSVDGEWWKKRDSESGESESGGFSSNSGSSKSSRSSTSSGSSSRNNSRRMRGGCYTFIFSGRGKKSG